LSKNIKNISGRIGITGGTGVLGSILTKKLKKNYTVINFDHDIQNISKVKKWVKKNNFDAIFHLASIASVKICNENPLKACSVNVIGTKNLLESIAEIKKKPWLFYASTSHVYKEKKKPLSETDDISPKTLYGYTKWMGEKLTANYCPDYNIPYCAGRIFSFYSDSQSKDYLFPSIKKKLRESLNKKSIFVINAYCVIDIQKAENVVNIILKLFKKKAEGIVNIATGKGIEIKSFIKKISKKKVMIKTNTKKKTYSIADIKKLKSVIAK
jgi:nucleoside-diphosphate-sugar epimerase